MTEKEWSRAVVNSFVRVQWDPDHKPNGGRLERRAIQLGLRGETLEAFGWRELLEVIDMTAIVSEQRNALAEYGLSKLITPVEEVYNPSDSAIARKLKLDVVN